MAAAEMTRDFYLVVSSRGKTRATKYVPSLNFDEIAIRLCISIPKKLFERPLIQATVKVSEDAIAPREIVPEVLVNTAALIEQRTGMRVELRVVPPEKED